MNEYKYNPLKMTPFKWFVLENFPFIEEDFDAITSYQLWCKLKQYFDKVSTKTNELGSEVEKLSGAFIVLKDYVDNYFKNLDVQDEINNKLDEMAEDGTLEHIINDTLFGEFNERLETVERTSPKIYNTINEMINDNKIKLNDKLIVCGNSNINDYGKNIYIATNENTDINLQNNLHARKINDSYMLSNIEINQFYDITIPCRYYITKIPYRDNFGNRNLLRVGTANDISENYGTLESNIDFAKRKKADVSINSGRFSTSTGIPVGSIIRDGIIIKDTVVTEPNTEYLGIDENGRFHFYPANSTSANNMLSQGIKQAILGWYSLMIDGVLTSQGQDATVLQPRQIIGQDNELNIFILTTDGRSLRNLGMTLNQCANILHNNYNCNNIYSLDGGGSTSTTIYQNKINEDMDDDGQTDRQLPVFLYIKAYNTNNALANNLFKMNDINSTIFDILKDKTLPSINGQGEYRYYSRNIPDSDVNSNKVKNGIYFCSGSSIANIPSGAGAGFLFSLTWINNYYENPRNCRQFYIPASPNGRIWYREKYSTGNWSNWSDWKRSFITPAGSSEQRPTENLYSGMQYWDWTINKPIWWRANTSEWVDAMGNPV